MDKIIKKATKLVGTVTVPGSKSYTHRVLAAATLAKGTTLIVNPSHSEANDRMMRACKSLGAIISEEGNSWKVEGCGGRPKPIEHEINVGNSGTALRLSIALATIAKNGAITLTGDKSLQERPNKPLVDALIQLGANVKSDCDEGNAPVTVHTQGLKGGTVSLSGNISSQYLTALLLVSPLADSDVKIEITGDIVSKPYIKMTLEVLDKFKIKVTHDDELRHFSIKAGQQYVSPGVYEIPGDYSQAAFPLAAGCLISSDIIVNGLQEDEQGDKMIISVLEDMGAKIDRVKNGFRIRGPFELKGVTVDLKQSPDLCPVLAVLGIYAKGTTRLYNMPQIRFKETDRIAVLMRELGNCGVVVTDKFDEMTIQHKENFKLKENHSFSARGSNHGITDHRVAMALSLIAMRDGPATMEEANRIEISYPDFFNDMESLYVDNDSVDPTRTGIVAERLAV
ncbi:MAG: 3-phosphoshikimate 1-carboxyvinyltransferase [Nitrosotalea sp.]